jgi:outer membrane protein assembly factor BamA
LFTSGEDLVGRHSYTLSGSFSQGVGAFNGWASYSYGGLENPILSVAAAQSHDASSRLLAGVTEAGDTVPLYLVEKERSLGFGTTFFRKRSRTETALSLTASHIWEDRFLVEEDLEESTRFRLNRPGVRLGEVRGTITFGNARRYALSLSPEKGVGLSVRGRFRMDLTRADSLRDVAGSDRSFRDLVGQFVAYQSFRGPGFGNHVVGVRAAAGVANGPGADAFHFEVGGASGGGMPVEFLDLGQSLLFPVRGYSTATRFGQYAWTATAEYRFPLGMLNRGAGLLPLHLDYLSGSLFVDAGNAWGPDAETPGHLNPTRDRLASVGAELVLRTLPLWFQSLDLRFGVARPLVDENQLQTYLRLGLSF